MFVFSTHLCRIYFLNLLSEATLNSSHSNQEAILTSGLLKGIKHSNKSVIISKHAQNNGQNDNMMHNQCLIRTLDKCFPDIDQSTFQKK